MLRRGLRAIPVAVGVITYDPALDMTEAERATQRAQTELAEVKTELEAVKAELAAQAQAELAAT